MLLLKFTITHNAYLVHSTCIDITMHERTQYVPMQVPAITTTPRICKYRTMYACNFEDQSFKTIISHTKSIFSRLGVPTVLVIDSTRSLHHMILKCLLILGASPNYLSSI